MLYDFKKMRDYLRLCPALMRHGGFSFGTDGELQRAGQRITDLDALNYHIDQACTDLSYPHRSPFKRMEAAEQILCRRQKGRDT